MRFRIYLFSFFHALIFLLALITDLYRQLALLLFAVNIIMMLDKLGKGVVLRETIAVYTSFICLVMPVVGYVFFTKENYLSALWVKYMLVSESVYFGFALPAIAGFSLALCWPLKVSSYSDYGPFLEKTLFRCKSALLNIPYVGVYLLVIGTLMYWISGFLPDAIRFAFFLFYFAAFTGLLYIYYIKNLSYKKPLLLAFIGVVLLTALNSGMFTVVAFMGLTMFSFFFLGKKTKLWKKILWFSLGAFFFIILQSSKTAFRKQIWAQNYEGSKAILLGELMMNRITDLNWESADEFFSVYVRANQGFNITLVMRRIPEKQPYDGGGRLLISFISALVPRFLWTDKPEAGGRFNMQYYTGIRISGWSTNVGPLGEAYGSFGVNGGIIFMAMLGGFIRWAYKIVFRIAKEIPLIVFWIPVLFYQVTYSAESDTLQVFNSLFKSAVFIWILYKIVPAWFGKIRRKNKALTKFIPNLNSANHSLVKSH